jgi:hypothetical protein
MHRSRLPVLAIFAAVAACSTRNDSDTAAILSQDPTLVATLDVRQKPERQPLPDACGAIPVAAQPAAANKPRAEELARQAYDAELVGNTQGARSLLRQALQLDGTDKVAAYHLGRTSEALGDRTGAITAYCRYLTLTPTAAESAEARQRVVGLTRSETRMAAGIVGNGAPTRRRIAAAASRRMTREQSTAGPRVVGRGGVERAASPRRGTRSASAVTGDAGASRTPSDAVAGSTEVDGRADHTAANDDAVPTRRVPAVDQASTASRTEKRASSRAQGASIGIGAVAGAIIGAATGRNVKSAVIGAAAGGILGTVVGGVIRQGGGGIRPWATGAQQAARNR